jgi:hypothetical protein
MSFDIFIPALYTLSPIAIIEIFATTSPVDFGDSKNTEHPDGPMFCNTGKIDISPDTDSTEATTKGVVLNEKLKVVLRTDLVVDKFPETC